MQRLIRWSPEQLVENSATGGERSPGEVGGVERTAQHCRSQAQITSGLGIGPRARRGLPLKTAEAQKVRP